MNPTKRRMLCVLLSITLCFIWGNSLLPASVSGAFSDWVQSCLNTIFVDLDAAGASGSGLLRKIAHATEFAVLGAELTLLFLPVFRSRLQTLLLCGLSTALLDETIQLFVSGRAGMVKDIWIDLSGFCLGILLCKSICAWLARKRPPVKP